MRGFVIALAAAAAVLVGPGAGQTALAIGDAVETGSGQAAQASPAAQDDQLLPPHYRRLIATTLLAQYIKDGEGQPEITQPRQVGIFHKTPAMVVRFRLSLTGANGMMLSFQDPPPRRYRCIRVEADRRLFTDKPYFSFRHPRNDPGGRCDEGLAFEPFTELEQMAGKLRGCLDRGEKQCVVAEAVGKTEAKSAAPAPGKKQAKAKQPRHAPTPAEATAEH